VNGDKCAAKMCASATDMDNRKCTGTGEVKNNGAAARLTNYGSFGDLEDMDMNSAERAAQTMFDGAFEAGFNAAWELRRTARDNRQRTQRTQY
jgi:hypothetical protein